MGEADWYDKTISAWRAAAEQGDAQAAARCLADGVEVISPLTAKFRFHGRDQVHGMLSAAFEVISEIRFHTAIGDADTRALFYYARAGREEVEEAELIRLDQAGLIRELTLFGRPLPALTAIMSEIGPPLLRRQGRPRFARGIGFATRPLAGITRVRRRRSSPPA